MAMHSLSVIQPAIPSNCDPEASRMRSLGLLTLALSSFPAVIRLYGRKQRVLCVYAETTRSGGIR